MGRSASVSVILPTYNGERYLAEAIESVRAQTLLPDEILVVDDGSTDGTAAVAQSFPEVTLLHGSHGGIGVTTNRGLAAARGEFLAFLDADDLWTRDKLEQQVDALRQSPGVDMVFGATLQFFSPDSDEELRRRIACPSEPAQGPLAGAMLARRASFLRVGEFRTDVRLGHFVDWYCRAVDMGLRCDMSSAVVLKRRLHGGNVGVNRPEARIDFARVVKTVLDRRRRGS